MEVAEGPHLKEVLLLPDVVVVLQQDLEVYIGDVAVLLVDKALSDEAQQDDVR